MVGDETESERPHINEAERREHASTDPQDKQQRRASAAPCEERARDDQDINNRGGPENPVARIDVPSWVDEHLLERHEERHAIEEKVPAGELQSFGNSECEVTSNGADLRLLDVGSEETRSDAEREEGNDSQPVPTIQVATSP